MSKELENEITNPIKKNSPGSILAKLFRKILFESGYTPVRFGKQLDSYITYTNKRAMRSKYVKRETRSHVLRKLVADEMTWKNFMFGVMQYMNAISVTFTVTIEHANKRETTHTLKILNTEVRGEDIDSDEE